MRQIESWECPDAAQLALLQNVDCSTPTLTVGDLCEGDNEVLDACGHNFQAANNCPNSFDIFQVHAPAPSPPPSPLNPAPLLSPANVGFVFSPNPPSPPPPTFMRRLLERIDLRGPRLD